MHYGVDTCEPGVLCLCGELLICALIQGRMSLHVMFYRVHCAYAHLRIGHAHRGRKHITHTPPVAAVVIHETLVVAKVSSYIHSGSCPSSWAASQQPTFGAKAKV